jgi:hypothetical protein
VGRRLRILGLAGTIAAALAAAALTGGCSTTIVRRSVERRIERRLGFWIGPAEKYRVRILHTRDPEVVVGRARRVEITGRRIMARGQFLVDSLRLTMDDLRYEGGDPDFISIRRSDLEIEFTEEALNDYLKAYHGRNQPEVRLTPDQIAVRLTYRFLGAPTLLKATGRLVIREGRQLLFDADAAEVPFIQEPPEAMEYVEQRVNPLLDLGRIDFPARLETVQILAGRVRAHGTAAIRTEL